MLKSIGIGVGVIGFLLLFARRIGLAPHDVLLVCAVGAYAFFERWRGRASEGGEDAPLLGEDAAGRRSMRDLELAHGRTVSSPYLLSVLILVLVQPLA